MTGIPEITSLQLLVMGALLDGEQPGQSIRDELQTHGVRKSGPAFYQLMSRIEDEGLVKGHYRQYVLDGQPIKERIYKLTAKGRTAYDRARDFYLAAFNVQGG